MKSQQAQLFTRAKETLNKELNKPIPHSVILDGDLATNDLAIYIAIQHATKFDGTLGDLRSNRIENISGVLQPNQGKSLDKLEAKGYILRLASENNCYSYAIPEKEYDEKFLVLPLSSMTKLRYDAKTYVSKLKCLVLANGNSTLPSYKMCKKFISRYEYNQLKQIERAYESATDIYDSIFLSPSKSFNDSTVHNTPKNNESLLEGFKLDLELEALLS